jgi:hypothetical protein
MIAQYGAVGVLIVFLVYFVWKIDGRYEDSKTAMQTALSSTILEHTKHMATSNAYMAENTKVLREVLDHVRADNEDDRELRELRRASDSELKEFRRKRSAVGSGPKLESNG